MALARCAPRISSCLGAAPTTLTSRLGPSFSRAHHSLPSIWQTPLGGTQIGLGRSDPWSSMRPLGHLIEPRASLSGVIVFKARLATKALRRPVDPEKPKRPLSAYFRYLEDFRAKNEGTKLTESAKKAGSEWKQMSALQRAPYEEAYAREIQVYKEDLAAYAASGKADAWKRDPEKPKKPPTPWMKFLTDFRAKRPELKMTAQTQEASKEWKAMTEETRRHYEAGYAEQKAVFDKAMTDYKASGKEDAWKAKVGLAAIEAKLNAKKEAAALKKAAAAAKKKAAAALKKKKAAEVKEKLAAAAAKKKEKAAEVKRKKAELAAKKKAVAAQKKAKAAEAMKKKKMKMAAAKKK